ncbi:MAG: spermidine synthase [Spirochaeta sp.]|jgi:spermidine synthase|nr:spermidine synthase [Spirochaeta sp.]
MSSTFQELGYQSTPLGDLSLRRRRIPSLDTDVLEVKLGDDYLMSSMFTESERELGRLGVAGLDAAALPAGGADVIVGGLGLGYTAAEVLKHTTVGSLTVVELFDAVIQWHSDGRIPTTPSLIDDPRCRLLQGDFFELALSDAGFDPDSAHRQYDAILVDIDHTPELVLDPHNARFYTAEGLASVAAHLRPEGVFGLWSDHPPDYEIQELLADVFGTARGHAVALENPFGNETYIQSVYIAKKTI